MDNHLVMWCVIGIESKRKKNANDSKRVFFFRSKNEFIIISKKIKISRNTYLEYNVYPSIHQNNDRYHLDIGHVQGNVDHSFLIDNSVQTIPHHNGNGLFGKNHEGHNPLCIESRNNFLHHSMDGKHIDLFQNQTFLDRFRLDEI